MNKKKIIIAIIIVLLIVGIVLACVLTGNKNTSPDTTEPTVDTTTVPSETIPVEDLLYPGPENPETYLTDAFKFAKEILGDEYYPNVTVATEDIPEMFGINPDDCLLAFAEICDDKTKADKIVAIQAKDQEAMNRIWEALRNYATNLQEDPNLPDHAKTALRVFMTATNNWNYVFLVTTFGDIDSVADKSDEEIMKYAESNAHKIISAILTQNFEADFVEIEMDESN